MSFKKFISLVLIIALLITHTSCGFYQTRTENISAKDLNGKQFRQESKAYLTDGSFIHYPAGFTVENDTIRTPGYGYNGISPDTTLVKILPLSKVISVEVQYNDVDWFKILQWSSYGIGGAFAVFIIAGIYAISKLPNEWDL